MCVSKHYWFGFVTMEEYLVLTYALRASLLGWTKLIFVGPSCQAGLKEFIVDLSSFYFNGDCL